MTATQWIRADTHVHFHACFQEGPFLDAAAEALIGRKSPGSDVHAALCLTESHGTNWFGRLLGLDEEAVLSDSGWRISRTAESNSVIARDNRGHALAILAGRQIVCEEGLEVLALGYPLDMDDGQPIRSVMRQVVDAGAISVVPWGFGKWIGARGSVVRDLINNPPCQFVMGDNGGRLAGFAEPGLFREARDRQIDILPGTDPFPFSWDSQRVGSFGIEWPGALDVARPFADFKALVLDKKNPGKVFGDLESIPFFIRNQLAIQLRRFAPG
jgi:hypothetical protein